jgi:HD-GYP domain-containing protein (c-di-GMP phosphodiesterase class II)
MPDASHGYPCGFRGDEIPLGSRIFAVVDAYDAITSDRPYRKARPHQYALEEIRRNGGSQFDPQVAQAFLRLGMSGLILHEDTMREHAVPLSYAAM